MPADPRRGRASRRVSARTSSDSGTLTPLEPTVDAIFVLHKGRVVDCNAKASELFGGSREQFIQELESALRDSEPMARAMRGEEGAFEWRAARPDGSRFDLEFTLCPITVNGKIHILAVAVDVTARRRSERALAQLSGRLLQLQDEERRRIARELHDTTGQNLSALSINLATILGSASRLDRRSKEALKESIALVDASVQEIRTMSYLLHPPLLDELGLESTLRLYAEGYTERTGISLDLDLPARMPRLPQEIETALFRIVQEGLSNVHRHSGTRTASLRLRVWAGRVELDVSDKGRGLKSPWRIGVGIAGMRERARQLGGRMTIFSGAKGTSLRVSLPIPGMRRAKAAAP